MFETYAYCSTGAKLLVEKLTVPFFGEVPFCNHFSAAKHRQLQLVTVSRKGTVCENLIGLVKCASMCYRYMIHTVVRQHSVSH